MCIRDSLSVGINIEPSAWAFTISVTSTALAGMACLETDFLETVFLDVLVLDALFLGAFVLVTLVFRFVVLGFGAVDALRVTFFGGVLLLDVTLVLAFVFTSALVDALVDALLAVFEFVFLTVLRAITKPLQ